MTIDHRADRECGSIRAAARSRDDDRRATARRRDRDRLVTSRDRVRTREIGAARWRSSRADARLASRRRSSAQVSVIEAGERAHRGRARVGGGAEERGGGAVVREGLVAPAEPFGDARGLEVRGAEDRRRARPARRESRARTARARRRRPSAPAGPGRSDSARPDPIRSAPASARARPRPPAGRCARGGASLRATAGTPRRVRDRARGAGAGRPRVLTWFGSGAGAAAIAARYASIAAGRSPMRS